ncbi:MAG: secondary thiamine-phosphate synthase enzyme YjbQ [Gammaproteobacteria bacterium]|nr:secondary thiamine-phosphate synthase enzyme YjbQ [Gammaproteobacteria bacterium]
MIAQHTIEFRTRGRGSYAITGQLQDLVGQAGVKTGLCHIFLQHTSASLMLCENADPDVRVDLETFMSRLAPDADPALVHTAEGPDDMPAHIRTVLTHSDLSLPVGKGRCLLGTWQGVYIWEHRQSGHQRRLIVTISGE